MINEFIMVSEKLYDRGDFGASSKEEIGSRSLFLNANYIVSVFESLDSTCIETTENTHDVFESVESVMSMLDNVRRYEYMMKATGGKGYG